MLLPGALRAFSGITSAARCSLAALVSSSSPAGIAARAGAESLSGSIASTSPQGFCGQQQQQQWRNASSLLPTAASTSGRAPLLRDADDEALSPHPPTTGTSPLTVRYPFPIDYYKDREAVVYSLDQKPLGLARLPGAAFNVPVRIDILHRVVRYLRAKWQQGTHKAKGRAEVSGGGRKPWPQKKTGRARQGSIRSPLWRGGGVNHPPRPRSHAHALPRATRLLGMRCALSAKVNEGRLFVVDDLLSLRAPPPPPPALAASPPAASAEPAPPPSPWSRSALAQRAPRPSVRDYRELKDRLSVLTEGSYGGTWLLVDGGEGGGEGGAEGARLRRMLKASVVMKVVSPDELNVYDVLKYGRLVVTRSALAALAAQLTAPHRVPKPAKHAWWLRRREDMAAAVRELEAAAGAAGQ